MKFIVLQIKLFAKLESTVERRHKYYSFGWKNRREGREKRKAKAKAKAEAEAKTERSNELNCKKQTTIF